jgi:hypothetical protein
MDNWMLEQLHQGMTVYDANGNCIGTVKSVFWGGRPDHDPTLPKSLENRLRREGVIVVDRPMARDPYAPGSGGRIVCSLSILYQPVYNP